MQKSTAEKLRMLLLCLFFFFLLRDWQAEAAVLELPEEYELGEEYEGKILYSEKIRYFYFTLPEKSRITLNLKYCGKGCGGTIYNEFGNEVLKNEDLEFQGNFLTGWSSAELSRTLPAGTYYLKMWNKGEWKWQHCRFSFQICAKKFREWPIFCNSSAFGFTVTESAHSKSPPARGRFPLDIIDTFSRTLQQVQSPGLNCYYILSVFYRKVLK